MYDIAALKVVVLFASRKRNGFFPYHMSDLSCACMWHYKGDSATYIYIYTYYLFIYLLIYFVH